MTGRQIPRLMRTEVGQELIEELATMRLWNQATIPLPGFVTSQQAADRLGVSKRTIQRYRKRLREAAARDEASQ